MTTKIMAIISLLFLTIGVGIGILLFPVIPDFLLPESTTAYTLVAVQPDQISTTRMLFSLFMGLAFGSAPLAALFTCKFSKSLRYPRVVAIFMFIMLITMTVTVFYYKQNFSTMFSTLQIQDGTPILLETIPYYAITLISTTVTLLGAVIMLVFWPKAATKT